MRLALPVSQAALATHLPQPYHSDDLNLHAPPQLRLVARAAGASIAPPSHAGHLLIIDDDPAAREFLSVFLRRRGFRVWVAATAREAHAMIAHHLPDLVLLDLGLPQMSGGDLLRRLRAHHRTTLLPIIIISASKSPRDISLGLELGADDYITKPLELSVIEARINALLRREVRLRKAVVGSSSPEPLSSSMFFSQN